MEQPGEGSPLWGWLGDEETLPLLTPDEEEGETQEPVKLLGGPWDFKSVNPFEKFMDTLACDVPAAREV